MSVRVNLRLPDELWDQVKARAERSDSTATEVVKQSLGTYLGVPICTDDRAPAGKIAAVAPLEGGKFGPMTQAAEARPRRFPNALQLSTRTGMPKVICQRMIDKGRVSVGADGRWLLDGKAV